MQRILMQWQMQSWKDAKVQAEKITQVIRFKPYQAFAAVRRLFDSYKESMSPNVQLTLLIMSSKMPRQGTN